MIIRRENRNLICTEIQPAKGFRELPSELTVKVSYAEQSCASNGIQLDNVVLPLLAASAELLAELQMARSVIRHAVQEAEGRIRSELVQGWLHHAHRIEHVIAKATGSDRV